MVGRVKDAFIAVLNRFVPIRRVFMLGTIICARSFLEDMKMSCLQAGVAEPELETVANAQPKQWGLNRHLFFVTFCFFSEGHIRGISYSTVNTLAVVRFLPLFFFPPRPMRPLRKIRYQAFKAALDRSFQREFGRTRSVVLATCLA